MVNKRWQWSVVSDDWDRGGQCDTLSEAMSKANKAASEHGDPLVEFEKDRHGVWNADTVNGWAVAEIFRVAGVR